MCFHPWKYAEHMYSGHQHSKVDASAQAAYPPLRHLSLHHSDTEIQHLEWSNKLPFSMIYPFDPEEYACSHWKPGTFELSQGLSQIHTQICM